jgi:hypothetical protein
VAQDDDASIVSAAAVLVTAVVSGATVYNTLQSQASDEAKAARELAVNCVTSASTIAKLAIEKAKEFDDLPQDGKINFANIIPTNLSSTFPLTSSSDIFDGAKHLAFPVGTSPKPLILTVVPTRECRAAPRRIDGVRFGSALCAVTSSAGGPPRAAVGRSAKRAPTISDNPPRLGQPLQSQVGRVRTFQGFDRASERRGNPAGATGFET